MVNIYVEMLDVIKQGTCRITCFYNLRRKIIKSQSANLIISCARLLANQRWLSQRHLQLIILYSSPLCQIT